MFSWLFTIGNIGSVKKIKVFGKRNKKTFRNRKIKNNSRSSTQSIQSKYLKRNCIFSVPSLGQTGARLENLIDIDNDISMFCTENSRRRSWYLTSGSKTRRYQNDTLYPALNLFCSNTNYGIQRCCRGRPQTSRVGLNPRKWLEYGVLIKKFGASSTRKIPFCP